LATNYH